MEFNLVGLIDLFDDGDMDWFSKALDASSIGDSLPILCSKTHFVALVDIMDDEGVMEVILGSSSLEIRARRVALICDGLSRVFASDAFACDGSACVYIPFL